MGPRICMILASWLGQFIHNNFGKASKVLGLPPKVLIRLGQCGSAVDCRESSKPKCLLDGTLRVSTLRILTNLTLRFHPGIFTEYAEYGCKGFSMCSDDHDH